MYVCIYARKQGRSRRAALYLIVVLHLVRKRHYACRRCETRPQFCMLGRVEHDLNHACSDVWTRAFSDVRNVPSAISCIALCNKCDVPGAWPS